MEVLRARLLNARNKEQHFEQNFQRRQMIGQGQRGNKRRTVAMQRNMVEDHITGQTWRASDYLKGNW